MLSAQQLNFVLDSFHQALKEKLPRLRKPSVQSVEAVRARGVFAPANFGILLKGGVEAKITASLERETALALAAKLLGVPRLEHFSEDGILALEEVVSDCAAKIAVALSANVSPGVEAVRLPTVVETNALLTFFDESDILKISIATIWNPIDLYVASPKVEEKESFIREEEFKV